MWSIFVARTAVHVSRTPDGTPCIVASGGIMDQRAHDVPVATQTRLSFDVILPPNGQNIQNDFSLMAVNLGQLQQKVL
jgi:hypothetical protein